MKVPVRSLTLVALDWAVATALGLPIFYDGVAYWVEDSGTSRIIGGRWKSCGQPCGFSPSEHWADGGPIIFRERIDIRHRPSPWGDVEATSRNGTPTNEFGPTPLIAAMRSFVITKLGDEIEVPNVLATA